MCFPSGHARRPKRFEKPSQPLHPCLIRIIACDHWQIRIKAYENAALNYRALIWINVVPVSGSTGLPPDIKAGVTASKKRPHRLPGEAEDCRERRNLAIEASIARVHLAASSRPAGEAYHN